MERQMIYEPISRFWSAFFSAGIFALFWTLKMEKTRKWILICILPQIIYSTLYVVFFDFQESSIHLSPLLEFFIELGFLLLWVNAIYFMYKWTSAYNLQSCGHTSKRGWIKSVINRANMGLDETSKDTHSGVDSPKPEIEAIPITFFDTSPDSYPRISPKIHSEAKGSESSQEYGGDRREMGDGDQERYDELKKETDELKDTKGLTKGEKKRAKGKLKEVEKLMKEHEKMQKKKDKENRRLAKEERKQSKRKLTKSEKKLIKHQAKENQKKAREQQKQEKRQAKEERKQAKRDKKEEKKQAKENKKEAKRRYKEDKKRLEEQYKEQKKKAGQEFDNVVIPTNTPIDELTPEAYAKDPQETETHTAPIDDDPLPHSIAPDYPNPTPSISNINDIPLPTNTPTYPHAKPFDEPTPEPQPETSTEPQQEPPTESQPESHTEPPPETTADSPNATLYDKSPKATLYDEPDDSTYEFSEPDEKN